MLSSVRRGHGSARRTGDCDGPYVVRPRPYDDPVNVPLDLLPHLRAARDVLDREFDRPLRLADAAARAGLSKYHFIRCFRDTYGETPMRYQSRRRIERAQDLLRFTNLTVTEVCHLVGYSSVGTFSATFRELVGVPPSQWQRETEPARVPGCWVFMRGMRPAIPEKPTADRTPTVDTTDTVEGRNAP